MRRSIRLCGILLTTVLLAGCTPQNAPESTTSLTQNSYTSSETDSSITESSEAPLESEAKPEPEQNYSRIIQNEQLTDKESASWEIIELNPNHNNYNTLIKNDPNYTEYLTAIRLYDEELDRYYVAHFSPPPDYEPGKSYPIVVMADDVHFLPMHATMRQSMQNGEYGSFYLLTVSMDYDRDAHATEERAVEFHDEWEAYLSFIVYNLIPALAESYEIDMAQSTLSCHSLGGLFAIYAMLDTTVAPGAFANYIISSPSIWYAPGIVWYQEDARAEEIGDIEANVWLTVGAEEEKIYMLHYFTILTEKLEDRNYPGINLQTRIYEGLDHSLNYAATLEEALPLLYPPT